LPYPRLFRSRKGRTAGPDGVAGVGLCARLRQLRPATTGTSPVVAPVQLASPARQPRLQPPCQPPPASAEQRHGFTHLGLRHLRTRPYTPRTNGKAERLVQTALREWAYARAYDSADQRQQALPQWLHQYNWHRPHASLGYTP